MYNTSNFNKRSKSDQLLEIEQLSDSNSNPIVNKITPGISTLYDEPSRSYDHVRPLVEYAAKHVPLEKRASSPLFIMATAGLRMLSTRHQDEILANLRLKVAENTDFLFYASHVEIISGVEEGVFTWIAVNKALGRFKHDNHDAREQTGSRPSDDHKRKTTVGVLDMGGASLQVAYEVSNQDRTEENSTRTINLGCSDFDSSHVYHIYIRTYLGYGGNSARKSYERRRISSLNNQSDSYTNEINIDDPCLNSGKVVEVTQKADESKYMFKGTSNFTNCYQSLIPLLKLNCSSSRCFMDSFYQPPIDYEKMQFYAFSEFYYTSEDVLRIAGQYDYDKFHKTAKAHCNLSWKLLSSRYERKLYPKSTLHRLYTQCFKSAWMSAVLHRGLLFPAPKDINLVTASRLNGRDIHWTLGALLYRTRYYAKSYNVEFINRYSISHTMDALAYIIILCCIFIVIVFIVCILNKVLKGQKSTFKRVQTYSYFMTDMNESQQGLLIKDMNYYY